MVKETGKNQLESRYKRLKKLVRQTAENYIEITQEKLQKEQLRQISNDHVNQLYRSYQYNILVIGKSCKTTSFSENLMIKTTSHNDRKIPCQTQKNEWKPKNNKELLKFCFRQRQMLAGDLLQQGVNQEKFKTTIDASQSQKVMTGVNAPLQISQEQ